MKTMAINICRVAMILAAVLITAPSLAAEEEGHHRHHVAVSGGLAKNDSKTSGFVGVDYFYRFGERWAAGIFYEEVSGDFDIRAWGFTVGRHFNSGWKVGAGAGAEYKFDKDQTLGLVHISAAYDWHRGNWTIGPTASFDFIEGGHQTYYLGLAVGYGF